MTADPLRAPGGVAVVCARHVFGERGVAAVAAAAQMTGDALAGGEDLDGTVGEPGPELVSEVAVRHRVVMLLDLDVIIEADPAFLPFGVDVGLGGQGAEGGALQLLEQLSPAGAEMARHTAVQLFQELADGVVQLAAREKKVRFLRRARIQRCTTWTPTSTFALSRGLRGRAGITAVA